MKLDEIEQNTCFTWFKFGLTCSKPKNDLTWLEFGLIYFKSKNDLTCLEFQLGLEDF
jgi:hypothetical protein